MEAFRAFQQVGMGVHFGCGFHTICGLWDYRAWIHSHSSGFPVELARLSFCISSPVTSPQRHSRSGEEPYV